MAYGLTDCMLFGKAPHAIRGNAVLLVYSPKVGRNEWVGKGVVLRNPDSGRPTTSNCRLISLANNNLRRMNSDLLDDSGSDSGVPEVAYCTRAICPRPTAAFSALPFQAQPPHEIRHYEISWPQYSLIRASRSEARLSRANEMENGEA